jgi:hypothetical protein|tara:strand:+ start:18 stop:1520 length:1503 start_codon:yes stop_codon:yes gene_type:complete
MANFEYGLMPDTSEVKQILDKGYYGRSPQNENFFSGHMANNFHLMGQNMQPKNRTFSALPQTPEEKQAIINQSWIRNKLPVPGSAIQTSLAPSNQQMMEMANVRGQAGQKRTTGAKTPPNWKDNLLNYVLSPKGRGMAQGLLEASGYSEVPVTFGQALSMGMKRGTEAETAADAKALAERQELMNNLLTQSQIYKNYQPSGNPQHKFRPMTKEEKLAFGIPEDTPARFNETLNKPEIMSVGGGTKLTVNLPSEDKGTESWFKSRGDAFSSIVDTSSKNNDLAFSEIAEINRFEQLSELAKTGKMAEFVSDVQGWADSLGVDLSGLDLANMGATQALNSVAGRFVMAQVQKTKGAVSDREMAYFMKISANIANSPLANKLILNMARQINNRIMSEDTLLNTYLDEMYETNPNMSAYELERGWKKKQRQFRKDNELFTGDIEEEIKDFFKENDLEYSDSTKIIENTLKKYPNAKYGGVADDGTLEFIMIDDNGKEKYLYIEA